MLCFCHIVITETEDETLVKFLNSVQTNKEREAREGRQ